MSRLLKREGYVKTYVFSYVIDVKTFHTPEEGAQVGQTGSLLLSP
jgi:hypothetical protein